MDSDRCSTFFFFLLLAVVMLTSSACTDQFYLSESEVATYSNYLATDTAMNQHFSTLQGQVLQFNFDSSPTPHLTSTNLLKLMRSTDMAQLETSGPALVGLDHLDAELHAQIENWIAGRLQLYTGSNNSDARLTGLHDVHLVFTSNPTFSYHPDNQSISFNASVAISINCTIEVNALDAFLDFIFSVAGNGINGTYALNVLIPNLQLNGQASLLSPYADAGRVRLQLRPQPGGIKVTDSVFSSHSAPEQVKNGVREMLTRNLSLPVDEVFNQKYAYFALDQIAISSTTGRLTVSYRSKPDSANALVHVVSRGSDNMLYHARKTTGSWSSFASVPFPSGPNFTSDPTLVHSGAGQLELVATDTRGNLVYGHWRDEAWGNFKSISPAQASPPTSRGFTGKPGVVASAPGQVEIVTQALDGNLWYFRRWNGNWFVPYKIPTGAFPVTPPFRDPTAVLVGNKVVIIFVDGKGLLSAIAYDLETNVWGQATVIPTKETIGFAPAAVASGDRRVDIAYAGKSGSPYHRRLEVSMGQNFVAGIGTTGISIVGSETGLGSSLIAAPVLTCSGYRTLELFGLFNNNVVFHNHFVNAVAPFTVDGRTVNPGWQGWSSPASNLLGDSAQWTGNVDSFSAAASPTGEVELVAHNNQQLVFYNRYPTARYGRDPWKTVDWRGYEYTGGSKLLGKPAVAAVDRNFEITLVTAQNAIGSGPTIDYALLSDSDATTFTQGWAPQIVSAPNPIDPILLSSGPGIADQIVMTSAGLYHSRLLNGGGGTVNRLAMPEGVGFGSPLSATSYGGGQIELVAVGDDHSIYHWRYRDGAWGAATPIGSGVISGPILMYAGAGQLELLAITNDQQLMRWRHASGSWTTGQRISSPFPINAILFSPSIASSWGDGTVDIVVVNNQDRSLNYRRIGPGDESCMPGIGCPAPRVFVNLGGIVTSQPVLTAFSPAHLNILARGTDKNYYSNWSSLAPVQIVTNPPLRDPVLTWSGYEYIGGTGLNVPNAADSGRRNLAAVAIDPQGRVFINRNQEGRWTGFQPLVGQTAFLRLVPPLFMPAFIAHGG